MGTAHADAYRGVQQRVAELLTDDTAGVTVPATPAWAVLDVVAHLCGLGRDWLDGNLEGYGTPAWTDRHVADRRGLSAAALLAEWEETTGALAALLADPEGTGITFPVITAFGPVSAQAAPVIVVTDAVIHEHDMRGALGTPGARDSDAVELAMRSHVAVLRFIGAAAGLPDLLLSATDTGRQWRVGRGEPEATLEAPAFELFRATAGRRSLDQIEAMTWSGASASWVENIVMPAFTMPAAALIE